MTLTIGQLLEQLHANSALPFEAARATPKGVYNHPEFLEKEQENIFSSDWICVGRQDSVSKPGDYLSCEIVGEPILVIRDKDSVLRAFSNVCLHRLSTLKIGQGNCQRGNAILEDTDMGPVAHEGRLAVLQGFVDDAVERGAKLLAGGSQQTSEGFFFEPTVLADVPDDALILREEPFGPIAVINSISDIHEGIEKANSLPYGLAAYAFTHSAANVDLLTDKIEAGNLSINTLEASLPETPFGGVKSSGYGREGGDEGLHHYTEVKNISHSMKLV